MESVLQQTAKEFEGKAVVGKVYDSERGLFSAYGIKAIPNIMLFRDGEVQESFLGETSKDVLKRTIDKYAS